MNDSSMFWGVVAISTVATITFFSYQRWGIFKNVFYYGALCFVGLFAGVLQARGYDLRNITDWTPDGVWFVFGALALGMAIGIPLSVVINWVGEEVSRRKVQSTSMDRYALDQIVRDWRAPVRGSRMIGHSIDHHRAAIGVGQTIYADPAHLIEEAPALSYHMAEISHDRNGRNLDSRRVWP